MKEKTFCMEVILDFDYTLFDTARFKKAMARSLFCYGVSPELFFRLYPKAVKRQRGKYKYSVERHLELLKRLVPSVSLSGGKRMIGRIVRSSHLYLYPAAVNFLTALRKNGFILVLVTHGDKNFQTKKVIYSGIKNYFSEVVVSEQLKVLTLKQLIYDSKIAFFVSDHAGELKQVKSGLPHLITIMKLRNQSDRQLVVGYGIPSFRNLNEIKKYIINYYKKTKIAEVKIGKN